MIPPRSTRRPHRYRHPGRLGQNRGADRYSDCLVRRCSPKRVGGVPVGGQMPVNVPIRTVGLPRRLVFGVRARPARDAGEFPPRTDPWRPVPEPRGIGEQVPVDGLPHLVGHMQSDCFGEVITHPRAGLDMAFRRSLQALVRQPQPGPQRLRIGPLVMGSPVRPAPRRVVALQRPPQPEHRRPLPLHPPWCAHRRCRVLADHRSTRVCEVRRLSTYPATAVHPTPHHHWPRS